MSQTLNTVNPFNEKTTPMQLLIMMQLMDSPKYGYEILRNLREDFVGVWLPKTGTIYPALKTLLRKGLITKSSADDKVFYSLSDDGREFLIEVVEYVNEFIAFSGLFLRSILKRMPRSYAMTLFTNIQEYSINEVLPEKALIGEIRRLVEPQQRRVLFESRREALLETVGLLEEEIRLTTEDER